MYGSVSDEDSKQNIPTLSIHCQALAYINLSAGSHIDIDFTKTNDMPLVCKLQVHTYGCYGRFLAYLYVYLRPARRQRGSDHTSTVGISTIHLQLTSSVCTTILGYYNNLFSYQLLHGYLVFYIHVSNAKIQ